MSLSSSIQLANNTLRAMQIGLQVVGQNIANANTPGYLREEVILSPQQTQRQGSLLLGLGVSVQAVVQKVDNFLEQRLRKANSDRAGSEAEQQSLEQLEGLIGELGDTDLSTSLGNFLSSISEVLNQPESVSVRNLAVLKGRTLAQDINRLANRVNQLRSDLNNRTVGLADNVNRLIEQVRDLNVRIAQTEGGDASSSDAVGLRDQRNQALSDLSKLIDIRVDEQASGAVNVYAGGDYLVFEVQMRQVEVQQTTDRGLTIGQIQLADSHVPLQSSSGELGGLVRARDELLGGFVDRLDNLAATLAFEFNKVYASGQGLVGYDRLTSQSGVGDAAAALNAAGLTFTPVNGSFDLQVYNKQTGLTETKTISVDLNGLGHDTTLTDLAGQLDAIDGVAASIDSQNRLVLASESPDLQIAFGRDSSGVLAALGLNTFFTGSTATGLGINADVAADPAKFAASRGGVGEDTANAVDLASFQDRPLGSSNQQTIFELYSRITADTTQAAAVARSVADGYKVYQESLQGQSLATSGVSIDEEAVKMIALQRTFQASAKYIATLSELLDVLVKL